MKNIFTSTRLICLTATVSYFSLGTLWAFYSKNLFSYSPERTYPLSSSDGIHNWCFIVISSGLLYFLMRYLSSLQTKSQCSIREMDNSLKSYSECTNAMIQANNELSLMEDICRICVDVGGHQLAWVTFVDNDPATTFKTVTHWGDDYCFSEFFPAHLAEGLGDQDPAEICIRIGEPVILQNLTTHFHYQEIAEKCHCVSCISLPLREGENIFGALVIVNRIQNAFDKERVFLLQKLVENLAYGIKTLRMNAEYQQETERRLMLAAVTEQTSDGVITFDAEGIIRYLNPSFIKLCGITEKDGMGVSIHDFDCSKRNPEFYQAVKGALETNSTVMGHFINRDREGDEHDIDARISPVFNGSGRVVTYVVTVRDVSQEVQLERQLRQAQKMEALATLSGGIAHDFNNTLTAISHYSERGIIADHDGQPVQEYLLQIYKVTLHGQKAIEQFLSLSTQEEQPRQPLQISVAVQSSINTFRKDLPSTISLQSDITANLGMIAGNSIQIQQVIINLCTNAKEAMLATGGLLEIGLTLTDIPIERTRHHSDLASEKHVKLTITDSGLGMDRDQLEHIFEPFYTTKKPKGGRGLGLSLTHQIVKNHAGCIYVNSIVGVGTTFTVLFPLLDPARE